MPKNSTTLLLACLASLVAPPRPTPPRRPAGERESFWSLLSLLLQLSQVVLQNSWNRTPKVHGPPSVVHCIALLFPYHHHSLNRSFSFNSAFSNGLCQTKAASKPLYHRTGTPCAPQGPHFRRLLRSPSPERQHPRHTSPWLIERGRRPTSQYCLSTPCAQPPLYRSSYPSAFSSTSAFNSGPTVLDCHGLSSLYVASHSIDVAG
jgi:hypothetical protein